MPRPPRRFGVTGPLPEHWCPGLQHRRHADAERGGGLADVRADPRSVRPRPGRAHRSSSRRRCSCWWPAMWPTATTAAASSASASSSPASRARRSQDRLGRRLDDAESLLAVVFINGSCRAFEQTTLTTLLPGHRAAADPGARHRGRRLGVPTRGDCRACGRRVAACGQPGPGLRARAARSTSRRARSSAW